MQNVRSKRLVAGVLAAAALVSTSPARANLSEALALGGGGMSEPYGAWMLNNRMNMFAFPGAIGMHGNEVVLEVGAYPYTGSSSDDAHGWITKNLDLGMKATIGVFIRRPGTYQTGKLFSNASYTPSNFTLGYDSSVDTIFAPEPRVGLGFGAMFSENMGAGLLIAVDGYTDNGSTNTSTAVGSITATTNDEYARASRTIGISAGFGMSGMGALSLLEAGVHIHMRSFENTALSTSAITNGTSTNASYSLSSPGATGIGLTARAGLAMSDSVTALFGLTYSGGSLGADYTELDTSTTSGTTTTLSQWSASVTNASSLLALGAAANVALSEKVMVYAGLEVARETTELGGTQTNRMFGGVANNDTHTGDEAWTMMGFPLVAGVQWQATSHMSARLGLRKVLVTTTDMTESSRDTVGTSTSTMSGEGKMRGRDGMIVTAGWGYRRGDFQLDAVMSVNTLYLMFYAVSGIANPFSARLSLVYYMHATAHAAPAKK